MASKKRLKKDVNFVTNEIIIECFTYDILFEDKNRDELAQIIKDTLLFRNNTITAINGVKNFSGEPIKNQYKNIRTKMHAEIVELTDRLANLSK